MRIGGFASLAAGFFLATPALALTPQGGETAAASPGDFMYQPALESSFQHGYVLAWAQQSLPNGNAEVYARRFQANGTPMGAAFRVNSHLPGYQNRPAVGMSTSTGDFVIVWQSGIVGSQNESQDGSDDGVYGQLYAADGTPRGGEFRVNTRTAGDQSQPSVSMDANGGFVVAWAGEANGTGSDRNIYFQRYDAAGAALGKETNASSLSPGDSETPSVSASINGFVLAWANRLAIESSPPEGGLLPALIGSAWQELSTINKRSFQYNGLPRDAGAVVASSLRNGLLRNAPRLLAPRVVYDGTVHYVAWQRGEVLNRGEISIEVQGYSTLGRQGKRFSIQETGLAELMAPSLSMGGAGAFTLAWQRRPLATPLDLDVYAQSFNADTPIGSPQRLNQTTTGSQTGATLPSRVGYTDLPVAWQGPGNDPAANLYRRHFAHSP